MDIGKLNKRITIQKREIFINENGFEVEAWKDYKIVWASIKNLNGKEFFQAQQAKSQASKKVIIRYLKDLDSSLNPNASLEYKIKYKNNNYNLIYSDNIQEQNKFIELLLEGE